MFTSVTLRESQSHESQHKGRPPSRPPVSKPETEMFCLPFYGLALCCVLREKASRRVRAKRRTPREESPILHMSTLLKPGLGAPPFSSLPNLEGF